MSIRTELIKTFATNRISDLADNTRSKERSMGASSVVAVIFVLQETWDNLFSDLSVRLGPR